ncbi:hypothetical protein ABN584_21840 [Gloeocapsa sp. BRSZ]
MSSQTNRFAENNKKSQPSKWTEILFVVDRCGRSLALDSTANSAAIVAND